MISILLATYKGEKYIKDSIDSIIGQTFTEWELLIGINGEQDSTHSILNEYKDDRIKIFQYQEANKSKTLNSLLKLARFDLIAIQDDDDAWFSNKLEIQLKNIDSCDILGSQLYYYKQEEAYYTPGPFLYLNNNDIRNGLSNNENNIANTSVLIRKNILIDIGGWKENISPDEWDDLDLWKRFLRTNVVFKNLPDKLIIHRIHKESKFNAKDREKIKLLETLKKIDI